LVQLDVKLILTGTGDTRYRTELAAKLLEAGGRTDVPLGVGHHFGRMPDEHRHQNPWLKNYDIARYPGVVHEDGIGAMIDIVMTSETPVTVIAIGPVPNLAKALEREPRIAARCRFVGMHGSFYKG
jgi:inosine-uridine nucleoside N-ribohydrolase